MTEPPQQPEGAENPEAPAPPPPYPTYPAPPTPPQAPPPVYGQAPYGQAPYPQTPYPPSAYGQPAYPPTGQGPYDGPKPGTNGFAIAALVFGIIPVCFLGIIFAIVALVQTSRSGQKGKGLAIAGIVLSVLWIAGGVTAVVVAGMNDADRDHSGAITKEGRLSTDDLRVGDCFNGLNDVKVGDRVSSITGIPCSKLHEAEDFAHIQIPGSGYPGDSKLQDRSMGLPCVKKLQAVAPQVFKARGVSLIWIYPTKISWKLGDHDMKCIAVSIGRRSGSIVQSGATSSG